jgi:ADP-heptose:LPS heptosyltransferase
MNVQKFNKCRIVLKRSAALGDCILATATIRALKQRYPLANITIETAFFPQAFERNPDIARVVSGSVNPNEVDRFFDLDLAYERSPQKHIIDAYAEICGVESLRKLYLYPAVEDEEKVAAGFSGQRIAVFHVEPSSIWHGRNLPLDRYKFAVDYLRKKGYAVLEVGEQRLLESDIVIPRTTFSELCAYMEYADIFIGQDSAPFHVAQAFQRPAVVAFGMINPAYRVLDYRLTKVVVAEEVACLGCYHRQPAPQPDATLCLRGEPHCMLDITDDDMKEAIDQALGLVMPSETAKCRSRLAKYCMGQGCDLGAGGELPIVPWAITVDLNANACPRVLGDATRLDWLADNELDFVYSSHLLEDFIDTEIVLREWLRVLRPGGLLILFGPDEQIYHEHCNKTGQLYNTAHKIPDFSLEYVKAVFQKIGGTKIIHQAPLINDYSFELVMKKET